MIEAAEAGRIEAAFDEAQRKTSAPLLGVLAESSAAWDAEFLLGACVLALLTPLPLLVFTAFSAQRNYSDQLLVALAAAALGSIPAVRRALTPKRASRSAGHRAALAQFVLRGLDGTRSGVLVYVSLAEHYVRIVPAEAAASAVPLAAWQGVVDKALPLLAAGAIEDALGGLAEDCAALLSVPFPPDGTPDTPERHRFHVVV